MGKDAIKLWYDSEADFLEVVFEKGKGVAYDTDDDRIEVRLDAQGKVLSFHVLGLKSISGSPLNVEVKPKETKQPLHSA
ncbi:MAG: DUF2283 domain-containing protein [Chloroflexi bacterium]|nr:DUF2283 domain-containing protein [Chloroflexota bacterium]